MSRYKVVLAILLFPVYLPFLLITAMGFLIGLAAITWAYGFRGAYSVLKK